MVGPKLFLVGVLIAAGTVALLGIGLLSQEQPAALEAGAAGRDPAAWPAWVETVCQPEECSDEAEGTTPEPPPVAAEEQKVAEPDPVPDPPAEPLSGDKLAACLRSGQPTLANFGSGWCAECKRQAPVLEEAPARFDGRANVVYVSVDDYADIARRHRVATIPCQIFFDAEGKEASRHIGFMPLDDIAAEFARLGAE